MTTQKFIWLVWLCCPLVARCQDSNTTTFASPAAAPDSEPKLDWIVEPSYWDDAISRAPRLNNAASAGNLNARPDADSGPNASVDSRVGPPETERILRETEVRPDSWRLGQSDCVVSSPILAGLLPRRSAPGASLGRKLLNLPVVCLLVPQPMPQPPGGGKYFKWGDSDQPWISAGKPAPAPGALDNGM